MAGTIDLTSHELYNKFLQINLEMQSIKNQLKSHKSYAEIHLALEQCQANFNACQGCLANLLNKSVKLAHDYDKRCLQIMDLLLDTHRNQEELRAIAWNLIRESRDLYDNVNSLRDTVDALNTPRRRLVDRPGGRLTERETDLTDTETEAEGSC
jgi:hypothetical protein